MTRQIDVNLKSLFSSRNQLKVGDRVYSPLDRTVADIVWVGELNEHGDIPARIVSVSNLTVYNVWLRELETCE